MEKNPHSEVNLLEKRNTGLKKSFWAAQPNTLCRTSGLDTCDYNQSVWHRIENCTGERIHLRDWISSLRNYREYPSNQRRMQEFSGGGAKKRFGANSAYDIRAVGHSWRTRATRWAAKAQTLPHLGHFHRKICSTWGTFSVKCAPPGALYAIQRGIIDQGAGRSPPLPRPCIRPCIFMHSTALIVEQAICQFTMILKCFIGGNYSLFIGVLG